MCMPVEDFESVNIEPDGPRGRGDPDYYGYPGEPKEATNIKEGAVNESVELDTSNVPF